MRPFFDEAHKMSASVWGSEIKKTKRYQMAEELGKHTRNLLLMTATPHSGKEDQFQLFMALLDSDRFEGVAREGTRKVDVSDMMRRLVKEELLNFDGTRLFPERFAYTVQYELSDPEKDLYKAVTEYVREEMNRNDASEGNKSKKVAVGFALTTLQRRLASSPAAIHRSLERRKKRLESQLAEARLMASGHKKDDDFEVPEDEDDLDELTDAEREALEDKAVAAASNARTPEELETEIKVLDRLLVKSLKVKTSPTYAKWDSLRDTLDDAQEMRDSTGARRKVIIFTEHKDTLDDLVTRLTEKTGDPDSVVTIHGGTKREDRKKAKETFEQDEKCVFLVATDAAGEGINLHKNAHLLINYDLPWNPNRIEQRFGRVHRIGQPNVCHMWSLVAKDTREGDVYTRLLEKLDEQRAALGGRVYDVLGKLFEGNSLRDLMIQAIREGDKPERQRYLTDVVDATIGDGIADLLDDNQLVPSRLDDSEVDEIRKQMERAEAARLQPHHVEAFFHRAFKDLGGNLRMRENHRYEVKTVPSDIKEHDRVTGYGAPIVKSYHRVTFDPKYVRTPGNNHIATLLHPGHPLMSATMGVITDRHHDALRRGSILIDRADVSINPYVVCLLEHDVTDGRTGRDGQSQVVSRRAQYVRVDPDGTISALTQSPIPNLDAVTDEEHAAAQQVLTAPWCQAADLDARVIRHASTTVARDHADTVTARTIERVTKTERLVRDRLTKEINYWDQRAFDLREQERAGKKTRLPAAQIEQRTEALARRLDRRLKDLDKERDISARPPKVTGACLVITQGWLDAQVDPEAAAHRAKETTRIERLAVDAVLRVEATLKHDATEMAHNNPGYDIESQTPDGLDFIEVKGRFEGGDTFILTRQEAITALNKGKHSVLALVRVLSDDTTTVRYLRQPINTPIDPRAARVEFDWKPFWNEATEMEQQ